MSDAAPVSVRKHVLFVDDQQEILDGLRDALGEVAVVALDERLTTTEAQRSLRDAGVKARDHRGRLDSAAAVVMLQHFLEAAR